MASRAMLRGSETGWLVLIRLQYTMVEGREASAGGRLPIQVDIGHDAASAAWQALQDRAPIVDDQAVAIRFAAVRVKP